jgi:hypothetical protein
MLIDCDSCEVRGDACGDCMVTALLGLPKPVDLADDEASALGALAEAGLLPPLRLVPRGPDTPPTPARETPGRESA